MNNHKKFLAMLSTRQIEEIRARLVAKMDSPIRTAQGRLYDLPCNAATREADRAYLADLDAALAGAK